MKLDKRTHIQALTGLRGIAAILVVMCHLDIPPQILSTVPFIENIKESGWLGVPFYFVLSGYLITWLALKEKQTTGELSLTFFFARRILRVWPIYIITCSFFLGAWFIPSLRGVATSPSWFLPLSTFTTNIAMMRRRPHYGFVGAYWTLALEEQFYAIWGVFLKYFSLLQLKISCLVLILACFMWRLFPPPFVSYIEYRIQLPVSFASILLGCFLMLMSDEIEIYADILEKILSILVPLGWIALIIFEWPLPRSAPTCFALITYSDILSACLVFLACRKSGPILRFLCWRPFIYLGNLSLCVYAINIPIIHFYHQFKSQLTSLLPQTNSLSMVSFILDTTVIYLIIIGISSAWKRFEEPISNLRHRCRPSVRIARI